MAQIYVKMYLDIVEHPKFIALSVEAKWAFTEMLMYCQQHLSDGFIDGRVVRAKWSSKVIEELTTNDKDSPSLAVEGDDFRIHNYCKRQRTRAEVEAIKEQRVESGSRGGQATAKQRASKEVAKVEQTDSKTEANEVAKEYPNTDTNTDTEVNTEVVISKPKRMTTLKADWKPSPAGYEYARERAPGLNVAVAVENFMDYNLRNARTNADWDAAWRTWVRKAVEFDPSLATPPPPPKRQFGVGDENV